jgi:Cu+-exporting ATPase
MKKEFIKTGMHCTSCATIIERRLKKKEGVQDISVNLATNNASVTYDDKKLSDKIIIDEVKNAGYNAELIENKKNTKNSSKSQKQNDAVNNAKLKLSIILGALAFFVGMVPMWFGLEIPYVMYFLFVVATISQFYLGKGFYIGAYYALKNKSANMDVLIVLGTSAAYLYSIYSIFLGSGEQYFEASTIIISLVILGKYLEDNAKQKASNAIGKLIKLNPDKATLVVKINGKEIYRKIKSEEVKLNDVLLVRPGEKVPVDGIIIDGFSSIDQSMITGESIPVDKNPKDKVFCGTINKNGSFKMKATGVGEGTTLSKIIKLVEDAQSNKAPIQRFADLISSYFVPIVLVIAIITFSYWSFFTDKGISFGIQTAIAVLVVACPCALGLATPTAIIVGTGRGANEGILIKGGSHLETAGKIKYIIFDKTGTITNGTPEVTDVLSTFVSKDESEKKKLENEVLQIASSIERHSEHPLAEAIVKEALKQKIKPLTITNFSSVTGHGVKAEINKKTYYLGNSKLVDGKVKTKELKKLENQIRGFEREGKTTILLADESGLLGIIAIADTIKETSVSAVKHLEARGIKVYMITGDNKLTAEAIANKAGIKNYFAEVLPGDKANYVKKLQKKGLVAMVGDGVNDAPALAQADVGIVMSSGSDVAMETGNIILMKNDPEDVSKAINLSRKTMSKIKQNMFWAFIYNVLGIPIAAGVLYYATGILLSPIIAGGAMALSSVSVVTNSLTLKRAKI